jgi:opacity protein-like surface antigen
MKKLFLVIVLAVIFASSSQAQDYKTSLGLRAGLPVGITVKHFLSDTYALEGIFASRWGGFLVTGLYEIEHWTGQYPGLNWYWGFGAHLGTWQAGYNPNINATFTGAVIGIDGIIGLEYTFDELPLNLSLDLLPSINLVGYTGWGGINGALSIRYVF